MNVTGKGKIILTADLADRRIYCDLTPGSLKNAQNHQSCLFFHTKSFHQRNQRLTFVTRFLFTVQIMITMPLSLKRSNMDRLKNKVAVITGGSSGIGLATAQEFINNGAKVVIFGRGRQALDEAVSKLGSNCHAVQGDVCKLADLDKLFVETKSKFGSVDILFVNAAQARLAPIAATTETFFDEMMNVNFKGAYFTLQKAIHYLNNNASVIITTSWLNSIGFGGSSLLSASKAALRSVVRVASAELMDKGIRVNAVSPGAIGTPLWGKIGLPEDVLKSAGEAITSQIPMKRWGQPEEIAKVVLFLASADSSYIAGNEITVDGGLRQI
jgi:NAD(P)-dependent dehydrogenase (short-subunit alcohol dehydrogenase family)